MNIAEKWQIPLGAPNPPAKENKARKTAEHQRLCRGLRDF
jgi:hypothetical protein